MVNGEQLDGRALLAVNVKDEVAWKIMTDYAKKERSKQIGMVETRRQVEWRRTEKKWKQLRRRKLMQGN